MCEITQKMDFLNLPEMKVSYRPLTILKTMALTSGDAAGLWGHRGRRKSESAQILHTCGKYFAD